MHSEPGGSQAQYALSCSGSGLILVLILGAVSLVWDCVVLVSGAVATGFLRGPSGPTGLRSCGAASSQPLSRLWLSR